MEIIKYPAKVLRIKAKPVGSIDRGVRNLVERMLEAMYENKGAGLAANQVGVPLKIFIWDISESRDAHHTIINPKVISKEGEIEIEEGCLSIPGIKLPIKRSYKVKIKGFDLDGKEVVFEAEDFESAVLQHEIDHLNGILIIDKLPPVKRRLLKEALLSKTS